MKIDWKRKLCSRKLWAAIAGFVVGLIVYFGGSAERAEQTSGLIMAGASVVAYILGEGLADSSPSITVSDEKEDEEDGL